MDKAMKISFRVKEYVNKYGKLFDENFVADLIRPHLSPKPFPREPKSTGGWTIEYNYLDYVKIQMIKNRLDEDEQISLEGIEAVLLTLERLPEAPQ